MDSVAAIGADHIDALATGLPSPAVLAVIPYTTFPTIELGPIHLRTFGVMVGLGVLLGAWIAGRYVEERGNIPREVTYRMATRLVIAGVIGARITWDLSHWEEIDSPLDLIAVWQGGLQFSGGFLGAIVFGIPFFRQFSRRARWISLDGFAYGLSIGLAIGRIGCYSVGEHFGSLSNFALAVRFDGGSVREPELGDVRLLPGMTFHNTALYELLYLLVLFLGLSVLIRRRARPGTIMGVFCLYYGTARFLSDFLRVNDEQVLGLTGAQYLMGSIALASLWILFRVRRQLGPVDDVDSDEEPSVEQASNEIRGGGIGR